MSNKKNLPEWGKKTYIMGILNVTPDSFSGDGLLEDSVDTALSQARQFVTNGAHIIDVGGESTRPGSEPISADEEIKRILPVIRVLRAEMNVLISVDTYRAEVAEAALAAGADWVNDVWGLRMDPALAGVVANGGCPVVLMHNRSQPKNLSMTQALGGRFVGVEYDDLLAECKAELQQCVDSALAAGISPQNIIIDPGVGFGKTTEQNLELVDRLDEFRELGYPILLGTSRKSFIGYTLDLPAAERIEGTAASIAIGIDRGADIVRVHDVKEMARVARMTDAMVRRKN